MKKKVLRLIDANLNRAKEGLRVCEDVTRFVYDHKALTRQFKKLRHECSYALSKFPAPYRDLVRARESQNDVGKDSFLPGKKRPNWPDLLVSNLKRAEEALRVLEETSKVISPGTARQFQKLRFQLYELEKKTFKQL